MNLEDIVFNKRTPTKKGTIIKNLIIILIILVVIIVFVITALTKIGQGFNNKEWQEIQELLNKDFNKSDVVLFEVGELDKTSLKNKLNACMNVDNIYTEDEINASVLFENAKLNAAVSLDKKDLTLISTAYLNYVVSTIGAEDILNLFSLKNVVLTTIGSQTNIRIVCKIDLNQIFKGEVVDLGFVSTSKMPEEVYITFFGVMDNTKPLKQCITSGNIVINNLNTEDNAKVLNYFLGKYNKDLVLEDSYTSGAWFFVNSLFDIVSAWEARTTLNVDSISLEKA